MVLHLSNEDVMAVLTMESSIEALKNAYAQEASGSATSRHKSVIHIPVDSTNRWYSYVSMEGGIRESAVVALRLRAQLEGPVDERGMKKYVPRTGPPPGARNHGLVFLFSAETAQLLAIMNDAYLQRFRVGATDALSADYLSRKNSSVLGILGSGGMAATHAMALPLIRKIERIKVYSPNREHRRAFARSIGKRLGIEVTPLDEPKEVVRGSDIVASCTNSHSPVLDGKLLEEGMHVSCVTPSEPDQAVYGRIDVFARYMSSIAQHFFTSADRSRVSQGSNSNTDPARQIDEEKTRELGDLILGKEKGRTNDRQITFFLSEGTGVQFAALGSLVYNSAKKKGLGRDLPDEWFHQKPSLQFWND